MTPRERRRRHRRRRRHPQKWQLGGAMCGADALRRASRLRPPPGEAGPGPRHSVLPAYLIAGMRQGLGIYIQTDIHTYRHAYMQTL